MKGKLRGLEVAGDDGQVLDYFKKLPAVRGGDGDMHRSELVVSPDPGAGA